MTSRPSQGGSTQLSRRPKKCARQGVCVCVCVCVWNMLDTLQVLRHSTEMHDRFIIGHGQSTRHRSHFIVQCCIFVLTIP